MASKKIIQEVAVYLEEHFSVVEICQSCNVTEHTLIELLEHGLIHDVQLSALDKCQFNMDMFKRIQSACRLQQDLGVNAAGVVLVMELLDTIEDMEKKLAIWDRSMNRL